MSIWRNLHSPPSDDENNFLPEKDEYCMCIAANLHLRAGLKRILKAYKDDQAIDFPAQPKTDTTPAKRAVLKRDFRKLACTFRTALGNARALRVPARPALLPQSSAGRAPTRAPTSSPMTPSRRGAVALALLCLP
ncbi:40e4be1f-dbba-4ad2-9697-c4be00899414 [Thermothielavioides terrestris]|uniref:40e4be1f-dbba-4ad2-9697-c4be00899414 n=1 Tax=Thermothielavioides terrestris TaxID=2587410 RepID=A0A3S4AJF0_9PEZI|nr:40e4be1f-dbba-4ad2-9697-c4be00899414 [Thermothielavioides terrestris]